VDTAGAAGDSMSFDNISVKEVIFDREGDPLTLFLHPEGVPRIEYDADRNLKGLLIEPDGQNQIRNGSGTGSTTGVIGSGGALPTNWADGGAGGLTREIIGTGTENGVAYIDIKMSGTAIATQSVLYFEGATQISTADGETWTLSAFIKNVDTTSIYDSANFIYVNYSSTPSFLSTLTEAITPTTDLVRYESTKTLSGATIANTRPGITFYLTNGNTYDFTVRIGWAQMEESPIATSPMPTTGSTFTRDRDDASMTNVSGLIGQKEGTLYVEVDWRLATGTYQYLLIASDGTTNNRVLIYNAGGNINMFAQADGGSAEVSRGIDSTGFSGIQKIAFAYKTDDYELYRNGSSVSSSTSGSLAALATLTDIDIGQSATASFQANMWIRAIQIIPRRLSDEQLIELTS
jgi:hypothetical protein